MTDTGNTIDIVELAERFGLEAHEQSALLAWTNELDPAHLWTETEAAELAEIYAADTERMRQHDLNAVEAG